MSTSEQPARHKLYEVVNTFYLVQVIKSTELGDCEEESKYVAQVYFQLMK